VLAAFPEKLASDAASAAVMIANSVCRKDIKVASC
jgi:hypothetical protein